MPMQAINRTRMPSRFNHILLFSLALLAGACQPDNAGVVRRSAEVVRAFESMQLQDFPGYRYWYLNQENAPFGVAGLASGYAIHDINFTECDPSSPVFPKVVGLLRDFPALGSRTEGYALLDRAGRQIGVWYSSLTAGVTVDPDTHTVTISTATPWMQER